MGKLRNIMFQVVQLQGTLYYATPWRELQCFYISWTEGVPKPSMTEKEDWMRKARQDQFAPISIRTNCMIIGVWFRFAWMFIWSAVRGRRSASLCWPISSSLHSLYATISGQLWSRGWNMCRRAFLWIPSQMIRHTLAYASKSFGDVYKQGKINWL